MAGAACHPKESPTSTSPQIPMSQKPARGRFCCLAGHFWPAEVAGIAADPTIMSWDTALKGGLVSSWVSSPPAALLSTPMVQAWSRRSGWLEWGRGEHIHGTEDPDGGGRVRSSPRG